MSQAEAALRSINAGKLYDGAAVLDAVSIDVVPGEVHALIGLNGAGKTTLLRLLLGMLRPDSGDVRVFGHAPSSLPAADRARVGYLVDNPLAYPELSVLQNLRVAGRLAGLGADGASAAAERLIDEFALGKWRGTPARKLSMGNRQRLGLAAALIADPEVLLLDEPTNALDPAGIMLVRRALQKRAHGPRGTAALVSSHHLDEVARVADRITVLNGGRTIGTLDPAEIDLERRFFDMVYADSGVQR